MTDAPWAALRDIALEAAKRAGELLITGRPDDLTVAATKSSPIDVVTEMDLAAEDLIRQYIGARRPDDGFLGEEGADVPGSSGVRWVVDPLDGTVNYLYGLPGWAVSIAAEVDGEALVGVVEVPMRKETFYAVRGGGAFRNGEPVRCRTAPPFSQALIATGFGYLTARRDHQAAVVRELLPQVRDIRRSGTGALDLCEVGCGRLDGFYERGLHRWDFAAGALFASEGGALVGGRFGEPASEELTMAAVPGVFEPLQGLLDALGAWHD